MTELYNHYNCITGMLSLVTDHPPLYTGKDMTKRTTTATIISLSGSHYSVVLNYYILEHTRSQ